jgi:hypothetical protein
MRSTGQDLGFPARISYPRSWLIFAWLDSREWSLPAQALRSGEKHEAGDTPGYRPRASFRAGAKLTLTFVAGLTLPISSEQSLGRSVSDSSHRPGGGASGWRRHGPCFWLSARAQRTVRRLPLLS